VKYIKSITNRGVPSQIIRMRSFHASTAVVNPFRIVHATGAGIMRLPDRIGIISDGNIY
jgi:hypothetical protein